MNIEYEATFIKINKNAIRRRLKKIGAVLERKAFLQRRTIFNFPGDRGVTNRWLRVRDEGDRITMSLKKVDGNKIADQKEICLEVKDYNEAVALLEAIGCNKTTYQETKRELWKLNGVEITIDEWPFLEPFVEVEGKSESAVRRISKKIGFTWNQAKFCAIGALYREKYGISIDELPKSVPKIIFNMKNPFINRKK